jgi:hypothetical protein
LNNATAFYVYLTKGRVLLIGDNLEDDEHSHHALQITINLEPNHFVLRQRERAVEVQAAIIKPDQPHHAVASDSWRAVLLLDPQTDYAHRIGERFVGNEGLAVLSATETEFCRAALQDFAGAPQSIEIADRAITAVVEHLAGPWHAAGNAESAHRQSIAAYSSCTRPATVAEETRRACGALGKPSLAFIQTGNRHTDSALSAVV